MRWNPPESVEKFKKSKEIDLLKKAEKICEQEDFKVETCLLKHMNGPAASIVKFAENNNFDYIVIGSRGRTGISRILLGSVAEKIIRRSHCTVIVVKNGAENNLTSE